MIDRENKKIINGFGTIGVASSPIQLINLILTHIEPPKEIGSDIRNTEHTVIDTVEFRLSMEDIANLSRDLSKVTPENNKIYLKGWEINFEEYNQKSVDVYKQACRNMIFQLALAC